MPEAFQDVQTEWAADLKAIATRGPGPAKRLVVSACFVRLARSSCLLNTANELMASNRKSKTVEELVPDAILKAVEHQLEAHKGNLDAAIQAAALPEKYKKWHHYKNALKAAFKYRGRNVSSHH